MIYEEYRHRVDELVSGTVKRFVRGAALIIDLGKVEAIMPMKEYPKTEKYQIGDKVLALLLEVRRDKIRRSRSGTLRSSPEFVRQLLIQEVPEVNDGIIIVDKIVRDAGYRTKLTVRATDPKIDPVGACVGMRGNRVKNVVRELHNEKIDIIPFSNDPVELLQNALSPIEIRKINVNEDEKTISIVVDDDNFAAVIGKRGMNNRLNADLIGFKAIEAQRMTDFNRSMEIQCAELASMEDPRLDNPLTGIEIEGVNKLIIQNLIAEGYNTPRALLKATPEQLVAIPGVNRDTADKIIYRILEKIRK